MTDPPVSGGGPIDPWSAFPALLAASRDDGEARERLVTMLYPELRRIAECHMRHERPDHTLQATALVSEFFLRLSQMSALAASTKAQFLIVASVTMRRLLVDYARARAADKRGGEYCRIAIDGLDPAAAAHFDDLLLVDDLLTKLAITDDRLARIVELRFFGGLTNPEIGQALGIHERTVKRDWQVARAWLFSHYRKDGRQ